MFTMRIYMLYGVMSVLVQILSCANFRSVMESNPFSERRGLRQRDGGYEGSSLVYFRPKHVNQPEGFQPIPSHTSGFQGLHNSPWGPARILHEWHSTDIGHPIPAEAVPKITSQINRNFGSSFQHNDDLFKRRFVQDASISSEGNLKNIYSEEDLSEEIRRRPSVALDKAFLKLQTLFDASEEEGERCVQEALWDKYGEYLKRRFKDCDFFLEDDQFRWRRYITRIRTCGKGWRRVKKSCRTVFVNHD